MSTQTMDLKARYYRALPIDDPGLEEVQFNLDLQHTALVGMHCWNIGCPDGPGVDRRFCVGMGWPQSTAEAGRIMAEVMRPAMDLARRVDLPVCHVETDWMDAQYPEIPSRRDPQVKPQLSAQQQALLDRAHGKNYMTDSPLAHMRRAEIIAPQGDEPLVFYTDVFDEYLKARQIDTLIYMGFATDMCILGAEGGARPMLGKGYRCILMRDATVGVETPESFPQRLATRYATHLFEWSVGYSTTFADFKAALDAVI
ncbi:MAG: isochorismatase family protein [Candidatus Latescibacteria bacterium]|nr:isochorismatase family protein [Candidatus Latescibacterota bacterium]